MKFRANNVFSGPEENYGLFAYTTADTEQQASKKVFIIITVIIIISTITMYKGEKRCIQCCGEKI